MPTIKRPRGFTERAWLWIFVLLVLGAAVLAASYFGIRYLQESYPGDGGAAFLLISALGAFTLLLILITFFYQVRKRLLQESVGGTMMSWLKSHVYLGLLALVAAVAHSAIFPLTTAITSGKITGAILSVLVLSGVLWRAAYLGVPRRVARTVQNLSIQDTRERIATQRMELEKLKAGRSAAFHAAVDTGAAVPLDVNEQHALERAKSLLRTIDQESRRERKQKRYSRIMQGWRAIHLPLAALLLGSIAFHLYDVFNADRLFAGKPEKQFASSSDCARCHNEIVNEWKLSMHRNAQTSTTTVAQSQFALAKYPDFKKVCVNCHAPVGVKFSQKASFPLTEDDPGANPQTVQDEGVTCVVCHTMPHPPQEMQGATTLPIGTKSATSLGTMFGPQLDNQIPSTAHDSKVGFMATPQSAALMCAACHNVKVDMDGDGLVNPLFSATTQTVDSDGDGQLDENELDFEPPEVLAKAPLGFVGLQDLALQTTFDEWEDYMFSKNGQGASCTQCHMPGTSRPLIDNPPPGMAAQVRRHQQHLFVAVDYDLNDSYYTQDGMPKDAMQHVLEDREKFLAQTAQVTVTVAPTSADGRMLAQVNLKTFEGHSFPTGFAFARQFWLEVSAKTASGKPVCLAPDPHGIKAQCASGKIDSPAQELATCDPAASGLGNKQIRFARVFGLDQCDPWLANWQKILTDADVNGDGIFEEVAHQSLKADIVKLRVRTADQKVMGPISSGGSATLDYVFDAAQVGAEPVQVKAVLRMRHLPPYLIESLGDFLPKKLSARRLLRNMTVVNVASNEPLASPRTEPAPSKFRDAALSARPKATGRSGTGRAALLWALSLLVGTVSISRFWTHWRPSCCRD